jgi:hypothetical protein
MHGLSSIEGLAQGEAKGLTASSPSGTGNKLPRTPSGWQSATP